LHTVTKVVSVFVRFSCAASAQDMSLDLVYTTILSSSSTWQNTLSV
jgi:hypothetical protein